MADIPEQPPQEISADERARHLGRLRSAKHYAEKSASASTVTKWFKWLQSDSDVRDREVAQTALRNLGRASAKDELCRLVIESGNPLAQAIALDARFEPQDANCRALYWFLTEQWSEYEAFDFDGSLLRRAYQAASEIIKRRVAKVARDAGRMEWLGVVAGSHQVRRLADLSDEELNTTTEVLVNAHRWPELWRLAQGASLKPSVKLLKALRESGADWHPDADISSPSFDNLLQLASKCSDKQPPLVGLATVPVTVPLMTGSAKCLAFTPDSQSLAIGCYGGTVRLLSVSDGKLRWEAKACFHSVDQIAMTPNGRILIAAGAGSDSQFGTSADRAFAKLEKSCKGTSFSYLQLRRTSDGQFVRSLNGKHARIISALALSPDGQRKTLVASDYDGTIQWLNLNNWEVVRTLSGIVKSAHCFALASDETLAISGYERKTIGLLNSSDGRLMRTLKGHKDNVECLAVTPDGKILVSGSCDKTIRLWSLPDGEPLGTLEGHESSVTCLAVSCDAKLLVSGSGEHHKQRWPHDNTIRLWSLPGGELLKTLHGHQAALNCVVISPDGKLLASGGGLYSDQAVRLWSLDEVTTAIRIIEDSFARLGNQELDWSQRALRSVEPNSDEHYWLEFVVAMLLWRRRFEIEVSESPHQISVGEFDIEIDG